jgi:RNA recognition motif-containing protein
VKKLYVGNLSFKATEEQVAALFSEISVTPDSLTLLRDRFTGQPRGFGFAEIGNDAEAEKAIAALNGKDFLGRALVVNEARPQREGGGSGGGGGPRGGHGGGGHGGGGGGGRGGHGGGGGGGRGGGGRGGDRGDRGGYGGGGRDR